MNAAFSTDHFSAVATEYANARPEYPDALFAWIATIAPGTHLAWEAGCGSGQASRGLAAHFGQVFATDPSVAQIAQAHGPANIRFAVEPGECCSLADASVDAVCVAQALHWFDREADVRRAMRLRDLRHARIGGEHLPEMRRQPATGLAAAATGLPRKLRVRRDRCDPREQRIRILRARVGVLARDR